MAETAAVPVWGVIVGKPLREPRNRPFGAFLEHAVDADTDEVAPLPPFEENGKFFGGCQGYRVTFRVWNRGWGVGDVAERPCSENLPR